MRLVKADVLIFWNFSIWHLHHPIWAIFDIFVRNFYCVATWIAVDKVICEGNMVAANTPRAKFGYQETHSRSDIRNEGYTEGSRVNNENRQIGENENKWFVCE